MNRRFFVAACLAISGCATVKEKSACEFSAFPVEENGKLAALPILTQGQVKSIDFGYFYPGIGPGLRVDLTDEGTEIAKRFSQSHLDQHIALFCGSKEISRPRIVTPVTSGFSVFPRPDLGEP
jgi:preprotein translocase subunit SecD